MLLTEKLGVPQEKAAPDIRTHACPHCFLCGARGEPLYLALKDRLFNAPGTWNLSLCSNAQCGLMWLDPMPVKEDLHRFYDHYYTHASLPNSFAYRLRQRIKRGYAGLAYGYGGRVSLPERLLAVPIMLSPALRQQVVTTSLMYLRGEQAGRLVEIGSGAGTFLAGMRDLGWEVEGVELDQKAVQAAYNNYSLQVRLGTVEQQHYPESSFDAIVMSHVLEHLADPLTTLTECRRILGQHGKLIITTPNVESLGHRRFGSAWIHLEPPRHLYLFSLATVKQLVERCGFSVVVLRSTSRWADGAWILSDHIRRHGTASMAETGHWLNRFRAKVFATIETAILSKDHAAGEEILVIAMKKNVSA